MVTVPRCPTIWTALAAVCVALAGGVLTNGAFEPNKFDICGPGHVALLQATSNTIGNLSAPAAVTLAAWIVESTGSWSSVFHTVASLYCTVAVLYFIFADTRKLFT